MALVKNGDTVGYGSYQIIRIGDGIYQLKDSGDPKAKTGGLIGVDMYLVRGTTKALLIDLGNNYIDGYPGMPFRRGRTPPRNCARSWTVSAAGCRSRWPSRTPIRITTA